LFSDIAIKGGQGERDEEEFVTKHDTCSLSDVWAVRAYDGLGVNPGNLGNGVHAVDFVVSGARYLPLCSSIKGGPIFQCC
jgi:hypothetical protein